MIVDLIKKRRFIIFIFIIIALFIITGCTKDGSEPVQTKPHISSNETTNPDEGNEKQEVEDPYCENNGEDDEEPDLNNGEDETVFEVEDSKIINGWKQLTFKDHAYTTDDWDSYSFRDDTPMISYMIHFPGNWDIEYSVFSDENGQKVAELLPPIIMSKDQSLLDGWEASDDCKLISKEDIKVWDLEGFKIILEAYPFGGDIDKWYLHTYYLTDGEKVFAMNFYSLELSEENQKLYDKIIKTFEFSD